MGGHNPRSYTYICRHCGKEYHPKEKDRNSYCSRGCYFANKKARSKPKAKLPLTCSICGKQYQAPSGCYCSNECKKESARRKAIERDKSQYKSKTVKCKECGKRYITHYGDKRRGFCSNECCKSYCRRTARHIRRARQHSVNYEKINPIDIFERDNWRCKLCGKSTPKNLRGMIDDNAPELDHIIPLSLGGSHTRMNLQCLCRACNQAKGATTQGKLVLI